jgi:hypothetical protein
VGSKRLDGTISSPISSESVETVGFGLASGGSYAWELDLTGGFVSEDEVEYRFEAASLSDENLESRFNSYAVSDAALDLDLTGMLGTWFVDADTPLRLYGDLGGGSGGRLLVGGGDGKRL